MLAYHLGEFAFFLAACGALYFSRVCLRHETKLTGEQLADIQPRYARLEGITGLLVVLAIWAAYAMESPDSQSWSTGPMLWLGTAFFLCLIFDAVLSLGTGVYPTRGWPREAYVYDREKKLRWVAYWQLGLVLFLLAVDWALYVVTR